MLQMTAALMVLLTLTTYAGADAVRGRGYYTDEKLAVMRRNVEQFDWARQQRDQIIARADKWLAYDDAKLRTAVAPPQVPRDAIAHDKGAPVDGPSQIAQGRYSWVISFDKPWKVTHPVTGAEYPSNDFEAYLESGMDETRRFHPDRADRSLLTGPYADDGWGAKVEGEDRPFWFVGVYAHWSMVRILIPALNDLSQAYLFTDDPRYAHAAAVLLWQLADYYPEYFYETQSRYGKEVNPNYNGRFLYHTWEALYTCHAMPPAYDAIRPAIEHDAALAALTGQSPQQIRDHIEGRMLRTMANDIMGPESRIQGNFGMHQVALLRIAAVLKGTSGSSMGSSSVGPISGGSGGPTSEQMVDWVLSNPNATRYSQQGMEDALMNLIHRDGYPMESPSYNIHWVKTLNEMAEALGDEGRRLIESPRFRKLFTWPLEMTCAGVHVPPYGDSNNMFQGLTGWTVDIFEPGYRHYRDPRLAKAIIQSGQTLRRELFAENFSQEQIEAAAAQHPEPLGVTSTLMPGVGFASLQSGSEQNRTAAALFYGYYWGHRHNDRLHLELYSWNQALIPDFGYPETADSLDPRRFGFFSHTVAHNTVMINARNQKFFGDVRGRVHVFDATPGSFVQVLEASAEPAYGELAQLYRRTLIMVEVSPTESFLVDVFRVRGGEQHDYLLHGTQADFESDLPLSAPRAEGTLAGADVPYGYFYDDKRYDNDNAARVPYYNYEGSGFQWLFNVQEAPLNGIGSVTWTTTREPSRAQPLLQPGVKLRAHFVGQDETVFACDGKPQFRRGWPETVKFVVRRRSGESLQSVFVTVFESYKDQPFITGIETAPTPGGDDLPVAFTVRCGDRNFTIFNRMERPEAQGISPDADAPRASVLERDAGGASSRSYVLNDRQATGTTARVGFVDFTTGAVTLDRNVLQDAMAGLTAVVDSGAHGNAVTIAEVIDGATFSVGDDDLTAGAVHVQSIDGATLSFYPPFGYFLEPGMTVVNENLKQVAKIVNIADGKMTLDSPVTMEQFPDINGDGRRTIRVMVIGAGDTVTMHQSRIIP